MKLLLLALFVAVFAPALAKKKILCYYQSWATYNKGQGRYSIDQIATHKCTHVLYAFVGINTDGSIKILDNTEDLHKFTAHVKRTPGVKALLSIGGASEGSTKFSELANNPHARSKFVKQSLSYIQKYNFDGVDIDWEYPNQNGGHAYDKHNFVLLLKELKNAFSGKGYLLTAAVGAEKSSASVSYDIPEISRYLDFINIMTYDFSGSWDGETGPNSPLYSAPSDSSYRKTLNINSAVRYWRSQGAPAEKIIVGIPFYAATFTLKDPSKNGLYAPTSGAGNAGPYSQSSGELNYNELCVAHRKGGWTIVHDHQHKEPYAHKGNQWMSYENVNSVKQKAKYIVSQGLGGGMVWAIDMDDFNGNCGSKYPLLNALHANLS